MFAHFNKDGTVVRTLSLVSSFFISFLFIFSFNTQAAVYKCKGADGAYAFQGLPCEDATQQVQIESDRDYRGLLKKWFKKPAGSSLVRCENQVCVCEDYKIRYGHTPENALPKIVDQLIAAWDDYSSSLTYDNKEGNYIKGCYIRMYQKAFNLNYKKFLQDVNARNGKRNSISQRRTECNQQAKEQRERQIKKYMSPPYNQSRRLAEMNLPTFSHMGDDCHRKLDNESRGVLPAFYTEKHETDAMASIERLK